MFNLKRNIHWNIQHTPTQFLNIYFIKTHKLARSARTITYHHPFHILSPSFSENLLYTTGFIGAPLDCKTKNHNTTNRKNTQLTLRQKVTKDKEDDKVEFNWYGKSFVIETRDGSHLSILETRDLSISQTIPEQISFCRIESTCSFDTKKVDWHGFSSTMQIINSLLGDRGEEQIGRWRASSKITPSVYWMSERRYSETLI